jgi:hypothetical protein
MVTIEKYAELCALMKDTAGDIHKEAAIAAEHQVSLDEWNESKNAYTTKMSDPADMGKTAMAFMPLYQAALDKMSGGKEPCTLEVYAKVHAEMAFRKDPANPEQKINYLVVLAENGFTHDNWLPCESYWTPKVVEGPKFDEAVFTRFKLLLKTETDRVLGIG